ncbi:hypothetical protein SGLAM104S_09206 [Streptomyces glaucescens]
MQGALVEGGAGPVVREVSSAGSTIRQRRSGARGVSALQWAAAGAVRARVGRRRVTGRRFGAYDGPLPLDQEARRAGGGGRADRGVVAWLGRGVVVGHTRAASSSGRRVARRLHDEEDSVPLSEHEQRMLEQMERALYAEDPKFATALEGSGLRTYTRRRVYQAVAGFLVGIALLMAGMVAKQVWLGAAGWGTRPARR